MCIRYAAPVPPLALSHLRESDACRPHIYMHVASRECPSDGARARRAAYRCVSSITTKIIRPGAVTGALPPPPAGATHLHHPIDTLLSSQSSRTGKQTKHTQPGSTSTAAARQQPPRQPTTHTRRPCLPKSLAQQKRESSPRSKLSYRAASHTSLTRRGRTGRRRPCAPSSRAASWWGCRGQ